MASDPRAKAIADSLPVVESEEDEVRRVVDGERERIPLQDIVITAIEHHEFNHFRVRKYDPDADGVTKGREWAIVEGLEAAYAAGAARPSATLLNARTVRQAVEDYLNDRLTKGMSEDDARMMVDGVYTDVIVCDSIVQFALYGEEVFG